MDQWPSLPGQAEEVAPPPGWGPPAADQAQQGSDWDSGWDLPAQPHHQQQPQQGHQQPPQHRQQLNVAAKDYNPQGQQPQVVYGSADAAPAMPYVPYVQQPLPQARTLSAHTLTKYSPRG